MGGEDVEQALIDKVVDLLLRARSVLFITGAGMSADSGMPTYRGIGGLYERNTTDEGIPIEEALSGEMLQRRPELCWKYILQIEKACRGARPNRGHEIIAAFEQRIERCWVLTQNVDGFHAAAGTRNLIPIHGDIHRLSCMTCSHGEVVEDYAHLAAAPLCPRCGGIVRPGVVLFGEMLPYAALAELSRQVAQGFDLVFSIGTTSSFPYIVMPVLATHASGGKSVEINPGMTEVSHIVDVKVAAGARAALERIWAAYAARGRAAG
ncbi:MAG: NAD-dependent protein deacylase [Planctomycetes bacterium]|nr:NAD-dependent protein deacylase [Planctomycetota bacterium]